MLPESFKTPEKPKFDALPEDVYQVVIEDVNVVQKQKYQSEEMEDKLSFKFLVLDEEFIGRRVWHDVRPVMSSGSDKGQASWLYKIYKAVIKSEPAPEQMLGLTATEINGLVGKQLRLSVKHNPGKDGNIYNKIDGVLSAKTELPTPNLEVKNASHSEKTIAEEIQDEEKEEVSKDLPF